MLSDMQTPTEEVHNPGAIVILDDSTEDVENIRMISSELHRIITQGASSERSSTYVTSPKPSHSSNVIEEDDGTTCPICLDPWTNLGEHRLCALKCGHLFGLSCISRWITILRKNRCPTCKKRATRNEIRNLYARKLVAVDVTEMEEMNYKVTEVLREKNEIQIELTKSACRERLTANVVEQLKNQVQFLSSALEMKTKYSSDNIKLYKAKSLELCQAKGCRVLSYYKNDHLIVASKQTPTTMFPEYGAQKLDVATFKPTSYIPLHSKAIRDLRFHSEKPWLLSVSLDKTLNIVDTNSNTVITTSQSSNNLPLWSCCWDTNDPNCFFVGEQGPVVKFDFRRMDRVVDTYTVPQNHSPVVSVATITAGSEGPFAEGGLISCNLNSLQAFSNKPSGYCTRHVLPIDPPFISTTYDNIRHLMLVSTRPTSTVPHTRHHVAKLAYDDVLDDLLKVNVSYCLQGSTTSKFLSRSCLLAHQEQGFAAAYQESLRMMYLWSTDTGKRVSAVPAQYPILDLCGINVGSSTFLFSLTESAIDCFKLQ